jgi:hypothetical protein
MTGKSEDLRDPLHLLDRVHSLRNCLTFFLALLLATAYGEARQPRFGIYMPKLDVYSGTPDVRDRVRAYLYRFKPSEIPLAEHPIISEDDLLSYDWDTHTMHLRESIWRRMREPGVGEGLPFVLVVDGVPLYAGAFWSGASSLATPVPVIEWEFDIDSKDMVIRLGHGPPDPAWPDPRGNTQLKKTLEELDKLKVK